VGVRSRVPASQMDPVTAERLRRTIRDEVRQFNDHSCSVPATAADFCAEKGKWTNVPYVSTWPAAIVSYVDDLIALGRLMRDYHAEQLLTTDEAFAEEISRMLDASPSALGALMLASTHYAEHLAYDMLAAAFEGEGIKGERVLAGVRFGAEQRTGYARECMEALEEATEVRVSNATDDLFAILDNVSEESQSQLIGLARHDPHALARAIDDVSGMDKVRARIGELLAPRSDEERFRRDTPIASMFDHGNSWRLAMQLFDIGVVSELDLSVHLHEDDRHLLSALRPEDFQLDPEPELLEPKTPFLEKVFSSLVHTTF
jgi:hypothetical protein